jgi:predicted transposase
MKQTVLVKLLLTPEHSRALRQTMERCNAACNAIAVVAFREHTADTITLQRLVYYDIRQQFGLSAQMTIRAIAKVAEAYKRDKRLQPTFRPQGAMVYDERICNFPTLDRVSLLTLAGRVLVPFRFGLYADGMLQRRRGSAISCTVAAATPSSWWSPWRRRNPRRRRRTTMWVWTWA